MEKFDTSYIASSDEYIKAIREGAKDLEFINSMEKRNKFIKGIFLDIFLDEVELVEWIFTFFSMLKNFFEGTSLHSDPKHAENLIKLYPHLELIVKTEQHLQVLLSALSAGQTYSAEAMLRIFDEHLICFYNLCSNPEILHDFLKTSTEKGGQKVRRENVFSSINLNKRLSSALADLGVSSSTIFTIEKTRKERFKKRSKKIHATCSSKVYKSYFQSNQLTFKNLSNFINTSQLSQEALENDFDKIRGLLFDLVLEMRYFSEAIILLLEKLCLDDKLIFSRLDKDALSLLAFVKDCFCYRVYEMYELKER